ncbi:hypothetical protein Dsin_002861 [Dipteronia sinensis]|uniref:Reverse transcriptase domain-containing protein n=1 Tax=Dipteronia sinensis TaxID=43782 RepID=A0AAE0ELM4_9ROSI|nr:hypothetical protein Dsin_002861 [Dipteronia sinensis]
MNMTQFRPISLCNTTYKILSKIIVQRIIPLLPNLVSPSQVAFVPGRQIQDDIVVAQEALNKFKTAKVGFIKQVLEKVGIVGRLNNLIMSCVSSVQYKVILNGELSESFNPRSGIRQGDPLSPYIFVLCMEKLSHLINQKLEEGAWKPVKVSRGGPGISHLSFIDDLILFGHASVDQAEIMRECLDNFCDLSCQQVSFPKSRILCSRNVSSTNAKMLAEICGSPLTINLGNYLGVPLIHSRITKSTYKEIFEKSQKRLASWKSASLSFAGRCTLIKTVVSALPIYAMQSIKMPAEICSKLDKLNRDFLWGDDSATKKVHLMNWSTVCKPKEKGGLGIKKMKIMNQALLAKAGWRLYQKENSLWANIIRNKYLKNEQIAPNTSKTNNCSSTWRGFLFGAELLLKGVSWRAGNGENIRFWTDEWVLGYGKLSTFITSSLSNDRMNDQVSEYLLPNGWNLPKLCDVLPCHVVHRILSIHTNSSLGGNDKAIWGLCKDGEFTARSAYERYFKEEELPPWDWNFIWKLKLPPRPLHFLWILLHGKLLTNEHRASRGLTLETTCTRCKEGCEDSEHVFRSCTESLGIWENMCRGITKNCLFTSDWQTWLRHNLKCSKLIMGKYPNYLFFVVALWFIWKWRCERIFNPNFKVPNCYGKIIIKFVEDWWNANNDMDKMAYLKNCSITWNPPAQEWVKLNVDGSRNPVLGTIAACGVIRDHKKKWLSGFALNKGTGSVIEVEL